MKALPLLAIFAATSCASVPAPSPSDQFFRQLASLCGETLEGRIASPPVPADADFAGKRLVMHVRDCSATEIRIPFTVGDDTSRTWVVTRTTTGLRLKHDHRHKDGTEDVLSQYGGDTIAAGTAIRQEFPADAFSKALFVRQNIPVSTTNVWAMEVPGDGRFAYELRRPNRFFRVEFER